MTKEEIIDGLISKQEVLEQINCWIGSGEYKYTNATDYLCKRIKSLSPVTPTEKIGRWVFIDLAKEHAHCSECGYGNVDLVNGKPHNYCENCGAKMKLTEG